MSHRKLFLLPGDGIGPEITEEFVKVISLLNDKASAGFEIERGLVGGAAYDAHGKAISDMQGVQWMIADRETELEAARLLILQAAALKDEEIPDEVLVQGVSYLIGVEISPNF